MSSTLKVLANFVKFFACSYIALTLLGIVAVGYVTFKGPEDIAVSTGPIEPSVSIWPIILIVAGLMIAGLMIAGLMIAGLMIAGLLSLIAVADLIVTSLIWIYKAHANLRDQNLPMDYPLMGRWLLHRSGRQFDRAVPCHARIAQSQPR
ncbi:hypothetical protein GCM10023115_22980 [Pontixanthobacter gangjinensis]